MQVGEEAQLHPPRRELLHPDPQKRAQVAHEACGEPEAVSVGLKGPMSSAQHQDVKGLEAPKGLGEETLRRRGRGSTHQGESGVPHTCTASATSLEELEKDIGSNSPGQGMPRCLLSQ